MSIKLDRILPSYDSIGNSLCDSRACVCNMYYPRACLIWPGVRDSVDLRFTVLKYSDPGPADLRNLIILQFSFKT